MERAENSYSLLNDLIVMILSRLPAKSIGRFRCVSKLWESMFRRPYFRELFLTTSRDRPRLLITIEPRKNGVLQFYSVPQVPCEKSSSLVIADDSLMKFPPDQINLSCDSVQQLSYGYALICFSNEYDMKHVIINPSTGQYAIIPKLTRLEMSMEFLGFDPIDKQFKLFSMGYPYSDDHDDHRIMTLGTCETMWRKIECPFAHEPWMRGKCININGVLYYLAESCDELMIVCFDVRSEKFKYIYPTFYRHWSTVLINYKGKLGGITLYRDFVGATELSMRILEDVEKEEWSKHVYTLTDDKTVNPHYVSVAGVTSTGDIVLSDERASKPFYVFYFNPERNTLKTVEIQGIHQVFDSWKRVYVDHVEDLNFNIMNATSISPPQQKRKPMSSSTSSQEEHHQKQDGRRLQEEDVSDLLELMTPLGKRILRDRPVKPSTKAKNMIWQVVGRGRGNRGDRG